MKYFLILLLFVGCGGRARQSVVSTPSSSNLKSPPQEVDIAITTLYNESYLQGDEVKVGYKSYLKVDSVKVVVSDKSVVVKSLRSDSVSGEWVLQTTERSKVGSIKYGFNIYIGGHEYGRYSTYKMLAKSPPKRYDAIIQNVIPINKYFLQGFEIVGDTAFFSSGVYGKSFIEAIDFSSKKVLRVQDIPKNYFAEGLTVLGDYVYVLTWESQKCLVYDRKTLSKIKEIDYPYNEGWGLANDGKYLYMSDGTKNIYKIDPQTFAEVDRIEVVVNGESAKYINELEWIDGEIWANVFTSNHILRIDPQTGVVKGIVNCGTLVEKTTMLTSEDFLNGIAFDKRRKIVYLSGKNWKKIYKVSIKEI